MEMENTAFSSRDNFWRSAAISSRFQSMGRPSEPDSTPPTDARLALQQARALREAADYEAAISSYQVACDSASPDDAVAHDACLEAGMVWGFMGEFERSLDALRDVTQRWPSSPDAHLNYGKTLLMLGEYDSARPVLERAANLAPSGSSLRDEASKQLGLLSQFGY